MGLDRHGQLDQPPGHGRLVERSGSGVELPTLDYENPGSNPGCGVKTLGKFFSLYIAPVHSAV